VKRAFQIERAGQSLADLEERGEMLDIALPGAAPHRGANYSVLISHRACIRDLHAYLPTALTETFQQQRLLQEIGRLENRLATERSQFCMSESQFPTKLLTANHAACRALEVHRIRDAPP
jgi:hypothetical protein